MTKIEWCKGIPYHYEYFLIDKYHSYITTCRHIEMHYQSCDVDYILIYENETLIHLLLFSIVKNTCICLNSVVRIEQHIMDLFSRSIFEKYLYVKIIKIDSSYEAYIFRKGILVNQKDDYIVCLPKSIDDYYSILGTTTRRHLKKNYTKFFKDYPMANLVTLHGAEISENVISKIIQLNSDRMRSKGIIPQINKAYESEIIKYSRYYGFVCYIEINGELISGCISYILNKDLFSKVAATNSDYNKYDLSKICDIYLIQKLIDYGIETFHFLWGKNEYKIRFKAQPHFLNSYYIYRNYSFQYFTKLIRIRMRRRLFKTRDMVLTKPLRTFICYMRK